MFPSEDTDLLALFQAVIAGQTLGVFPGGKWQPAVASPNLLHGTVVGGLPSSSSTETSIFSRKGRCHP